MAESAWKLFFVFLGTFAAVVIASQDVGVKTPKRMEGALTCALGRTAVAAGTAYVMSRDLRITVAAVVAYNAMSLALADPPAPALPPLPRG